MSREIHIHVEEPSMEAFLVELLARCLHADVAWRPIDYGSNQTMLARLPQRLVGYARIPQDVRPLSLVLIDRDDDDCRALKQQLDEACISAGLATIGTRRPDGGFCVVNRIVIEELEAWFFGDGVALETGWRNMGRVVQKAPYRDPDAVRGTHEALLREMQRAGHWRGLDRLPKIDTARKMGRLVDPERNTSCSFGHFWTGLNALVAIA